MQAQEQEELSIKENATLFQQLLEKRRKHFSAKRAEEKRNKPPTKAQQRKIITFKRVNTFEDFRTELVEGKEKRAGTELVQEITKKQKVEDDKEAAELKQCLEIIPDEEKVTINAIPLAVKSLMPLTSTFKASEGSLILSSSKIPTILGYVANLLMILAFYNARPIVVQLAFVAQRASIVVTFLLPLVASILCYLVFLLFGLAH
ncbi:hypothetical protein Tco_1409679 [Tanacetum coccineum]